jgi:protein-disulfide isomerase
MKFYRAVIPVLLVAPGLLAQHNPPDSPAPPAKAAPPQAASPANRKVEAYLRNLYALGAKYTVKVGEPQPTPIPGLRSVTIEISTEGQSSGGIVYLSEDGRYILQGELSDMHADAFAKIRKGMDLSAAPSRGPADAKVVVVEYADLQCPSCRLLNQALKSIVPNYPQVRFVFREFPLTQIHAWALTAATAGRCIYHKNPPAFWTYADYIFGRQDIITADNVWQTVQEQALAAGFDEAGFKACMIDPAMKQEIDNSTVEATELKVANTPTVFINGRRLVGGDREALVQYIDYELAQINKTKKPGVGGISPQ